MYMYIEKQINNNRWGSITLLWFIIQINSNKTEHRSVAYRIIRAFEVVYLFIEAIITNIIDEIYVCLHTCIMAWTS